MAENKSREIRLEEIINAGIVCFSARGYTATSVSEICREAGITKGGFYWHFKSKKELLQAVMDNLCSSQERLWKGLANLEISRDAIRNVGSEFITTSLASPEKIRLKAVLEAEALRDGDIMETLRESQNWVLSQLEIFSGKILSVFPSIPMDEKSLAGLMNTIVTGCIRDGILLDNRESEDDLWNTFVDGLIR